MEHIFEKKIAEIASPDDPAHDLLHFKRVVSVAKKICATEGGNLDVVVPAAWLHDFIIVPKDSPLRSQASRLSAQRAIEFLKQIGYPEAHHAAIAHAIECHSFSAGLECKTLEAKIVQDADRLDGLGAIGIARVFAVSGMLRRAFYRELDPFCEDREPDDTVYTLDHFYRKLFNTAQTMKTAAGRGEGERRARVMRRYLEDLQREI